MGDGVAVASAADRDEQPIDDAISSATPRSTRARRGYKG